MCTVSWFHTQDGYELFFNRDELRTRKRALPPRPLAGPSGIAMLAPTDADAGGTWIAANTTGLTVALLNRYQDSADPTTADSRRSRGLLVRDLADASNARQINKRLRSDRIEIYAPFTLLVVTPEDPGTMIFWNGRQLSEPCPATAPLASSGHDAVEVPASRRKLWAGLSKIDRVACLSFHRSHAPRPGAESPCMHRPEAHSVSLTHVVVDEQRISMAYADGPPCRAELSLAADSVLRRTAGVNAA